MSIRHGVLIPARVSKRARQMLRGLAKSIPGAVVFEHYQPCRTLLLYGWGGDEQQRAIKAHRGRYACFDLGYWCRSGAGGYHWRVSIDGGHPPQLVTFDAGPERFDRYGLRVHRKRYDPDGPVLLIANSSKSYKVGAEGWSRKKMAELRQLTDRPIWFKVKPNKQPERGVSADRVVYGDIYDVLPKVSAVVCRHSNVTVDAAFYGVAAACDDGIGAAIYPRTLKGEQPGYEQRLRFLHQVAWWQWSTDEIRRGHCWRWLAPRLED